MAVATKTRKTAKKVKQEEMGTRDPLVIANYLLRRSWAQGKEGLEPVPIIKLVYIAHGFFLAHYDKPLIREPVQAWKYGPIISSLYHAVKGRGESKPVRELLAGAGDGSDLSKDEKELLDEVLKSYGDQTSPELSSIANKRGSPWKKIWKGTHPEDIPNVLIKEYYVKLLEDYYAKTNAA